MTASRKNHTLLIFLISVGVAFRTLIAAEPSLPIEGVYHLQNGYQSETLELRAGHFRYWFSTDYGARSGREPLEGAYSLEGSTLILHRDDIHLGNQRVFHVLNGIDALWSPVALEEWISNGQLSTYGIIVKVQDPPVDLAEMALPIPPEVRSALSNRQRTPK